MKDVLLLALGLVIWYVYYGLECALNGVMCGGWFMPFREWWVEFRWNWPIVGRKYKLQAVGGKEEDVILLPGTIHFGLVCILLPLLPWLINRL